MLCAMARLLIERISVLVFAVIKCIFTTLCWFLPTNIAIFLQISNMLKKTNNKSIFISLCWQKPTQTNTLSHSLSFHKLQSQACTISLSNYTPPHLSCYLSRHNLRFLNS